MDLNRRSVLRKASALSALAVGASVTASAADCSGVPEWDSDTAYDGGDQVTYDGDLFTAEWWTKGETPDDSKSVWTKDGSCDGDGGGGGGGDCSGVPAWDSAATYSGGDRVTHDGALWEAQWWIQGTEPSRDANVWSRQGDCSDGGGGGNESPNASFTVSPYSPEPGESATFDAADSSDADGSIAGYEWEFGDGSTASGESVTHSFDSAGDYTVSLTVTDDDGATNTNSRTVSVETDPGGSGVTTFAPYKHMTTQPGTSLVDHYSQADNDAFTLAFVLSDGNGNAAWDGAPDQLVGDFGLASEIQSYQDAGGEVIVSFGGAVGTMIAQDATDISAIKSEYETVMDTYGVTHLDFDIESVNQDAVDRRNQALAELQSERPELKVSYTLRCRTTGLTSHGTYVVESARDHGVDLQYVNIMTMNYGWVEPSASTVIESANGTHSDLQSIFSGLSSDEAWSMLGLTPMIGENNAGGPHNLADAQEVASFVQNKGVGLVSFWSIDRDNGSCATGTVSPTCSGVQQDPYAFSEIYNDVQ